MDATDAPPRSAGVDLDQDGPLVLASVPLMFIHSCGSLGLGIDTAALIAAGGRDPAELASDPDALVDYEILMRLWHEALRQVGDRPLGLRYARHLAASQEQVGRAFGIVGYALSNCRNIRQALQLGIRFGSIVDPLYTVILEESGSSARVLVDHDPRVVAMVEPMEYLVLTVCNMLYMSADERPKIDELYFRHPPRHAPEVYAELVGIPIHFESEWYGISFDAAALDRPITGSDPQLGKYLVQQAEALLEEHDPPPKTEPLDAQVRRLIDESLISGLLDQAAVAKQLGMSTRTLQRGLEALQTSFSAQVEEVRRSRALQLIRRPELSAAEMAFMLGYGDPRTFYRSFRRWTGSTPTTYRRDHDHLQAH